MMNLDYVNGYAPSAGAQSPVPNTPVPRATVPLAAAPGSPLSGDQSGSAATNQITVSWVALVALAVLTRVFIEKTGAKVD